MIATGRNQWLRSEFPVLYLETFESCKEPGSPLELQHLIDAFPLEAETLSVFKPLSTEIMRLMRVRCHARSNT